jgi:hypothetical protein
MKTKYKPGEPPSGKIGCYDADMNLRGHCTAAATDATVSRFVGVRGSTLGKVNNRTAWIAPARRKAK